MSKNIMSQCFEICLHGQNARIAAQPKAATCKFEGLTRGLSYLPMGFGFKMEIFCNFNGFWYLKHSFSPSNGITIQTRKFRCVRYLLGVPGGSRVVVERTYTRRNCSYEDPLQPSFLYSTDSHTLEIKGFRVQDLGLKACADPQAH